MRPNFSRKRNVRDIIKIEQGKTDFWYSLKTKFNGSKIELFKIEGTVYEQKIVERTD